MAKTDLAEGILRTYIQSTDYTPDHPDYCLFKQECDSIRTALRIIADYNRREQQRKARLSDVRQPEGKAS